MSIFNKNKVLICISCISVIFFVTACENTESSKPDFIADFDKLTAEVCGKNKIRTQYEWDDSDRKLKIFINEKYKVFYEVLNVEEKKNIWEKSFAYTYLRFGGNLMKKFSESDFMIMKITDSLNYYYKNPELASEKIYNHCLFHLNKPEPEILSDVKKILNKRQKN